MHSLLDVLAALYRTSNSVHLERLPVLISGVDGWPHDDHGITDELDDVAAILIEASDHAFHVSIDTESQVLITLEAIFRTTFRQIGEATDVCKHDNGFHCLQLW